MVGKGWLRVGALNVTIQSLPSCHQDSPHGWASLSFVSYQKSLTKYKKATGRGLRVGCLSPLSQSALLVSEAGLLKVAESLDPRQPEKAVLLLGAEQQLQARKARCQGRTPRGSWPAVPVPTTFPRVKLRFQGTSWFNTV